MDKSVPKTLEELKKIINEQDAALMIKAQQERLSLMEQQAFNKLQERLVDEEGMNELPSVDQLQKMYMQPTPSYKAQSGTDGAIAKIFENFEKEFGKENIQNNSLHFPDDDDNSKANDFFRRQANEGHAFLFKQSNCDNYAFSDGKGHYKMGSKEEIISYCKSNSIEAPPALDRKPYAEPESPPLSMTHN